MENIVDIEYHRRLPDDIGCSTLATTSALNGCRIINLNNLEHFIGEISSHSSNCGDEIILVGESRDGLASILIEQCNFCQIDFPTCSNVCGPTGNRHWKYNLDAVWGQMAIAGGYCHLQESMAVLSVPTMTKKPFKCNETIIGKWWWDLAKKACSDAIIPSPSVFCKDSGLVIHRKHHWLAASSDGLVTDLDVTPTTGLVEIKNPYKFSNNRSSQNIRLSFKTRRK